MTGGGSLNNMLARTKRGTIEKRHAPNRQPLFGQIKPSRIPAIVKLPIYMENRIHNDIGGCDSVANASDKSKATPATAAMILARMSLLFNNVTNLLR